MTSRSSIACFATYRPPVPLDIFSRPVNPSARPEVDEVLLSDGDFYNQNCREIPTLALKEILTFLHSKNPRLAADCGARPDDAENGRVTGVLFVSERDNGLELLHVALRFSDDKRLVKVLSLGDIYGKDDTFGGVRMEDSGCFAGGFTVGRNTVGHSLVYVSTKEPAEERRTPWTVVYRTNLADGKTVRLTPPYQYDLNPAVSPSGKFVAVANFRWNQWTGEIEKLNTHIAVMNVDREAQGGLDRVILIKNGGWPTWGSDNVIFFHRGTESTTGDGKIKWGVFRYDIATKRTDPVTPANAMAMTPVAISETRVAVAIIREQKNELAGKRQMEHYRHIEIFDTTAPERPPVRITQAKADHYNPSVLDGGRRIGYHRCRTDMLLQGGKVIPRKIQKLETPPSHSDVGLFRLMDAFPAISSDGSKLAFVDNEFKAVWVADSTGLRVVCKRTTNRIFSVVWNPDKAKDTLYICEGPAFSRKDEVAICALRNVSKSHKPDEATLTIGGFNDAFPSCNPDGTQLVFRSTRDRSTGNKDDRQYKNLYILRSAKEGEYGGLAERITDGEWTDTHCSWSPSGDWIIFSSSRDKTPDSPPLDNGLDSGYFAVYVVKAADPKVVIRVVTSALTIAGHVNHPMFSPDCTRLAFTSDLAAVSADPISMPLFLHSVRPYGDIFAIDIDLDELDDCAKRPGEKRLDVDRFHRLTHSRYEYSMPAWTSKAVDDPSMQWKLAMLDDEKTHSFRPKCPYKQPDEGESWHMTGQLCIPKRCC